MWNKTNKTNRIRHTHWRDTNQRSVTRGRPRGSCLACQTKKIRTASVMHQGRQILTWHRLDVSHTRPAYRVLSRMSFLIFDQHGWHRPMSVIVSISRIMRHQHSCSVIHKLSAWVRTEIYTLQSCLVFGSRKSNILLNVNSPSEDEVQISWATWRLRTDCFTTDTTLETQLSH